jgi:tetratricopeptide (TPR) repeat protein
VKSEQFVASLAKELQAAKLLPEKYDAAELLAAMKRTAERATGPNLGTLLPTAMMTVGGGGLSAAQLVDIAERLTKAEASAKVASDRLAAETKRLTTEHATALKKLTDMHAADLKKLTDAYATDVSKLKDDQKAELKKASDKFADDSKKLKESFDGKVKDLETAVESEKKRVEAVTAQFKIDLGNAISPSQALDLWLPLLTELRRPADSDAAIAGATKVIASAAPNSEDAGKARTVAGMALLNRGDLTLAKAQFEAARANPTHKPALAAKKPWAVAADVGLASVSDPLAPYRRPVELPARDAAAAARLLDAGVKAYRTERYSEALAALTDSTKADPTNPVAWYYLGAARWATGKPDDARDAFQQGGLREAASSVSARVIGAAIAPIQGPARDALTAARP